LPDPLLIQIDGELAAQHMLPLYEGGEALAGIGLSFTRVSHYLLTGEVRHRAPYDPRLKILTRSPRRGSIEFDFVGFLAGPAPTSVIGQITISVTAAVVIGLGIRLIKRITGRHQPNETDSMTPVEKQRPGDIDALASSIVAPTKRTHSIIGHGATVINIIGNNNEVILDKRSKDYIFTTIEADDDSWIDVSIGWLNANQQTGGAFNYELGRIVPFDISKVADQKSLLTLSRSHTEYFLGNKEGSAISVRVRPSMSVDGTVKHYLLLEAKEIDDE
jgi:hypothetical protein